MPRPRFTTAFVLAAVLVATCASRTVGHSPEVLIASTPFGIDVTRNMGVNNLSTAAGAMDNHTKLNHAMTLREAGGQTHTYAFQFPARNFWFRGTISVPRRVGFRLQGVGIGGGSSSHYTGAGSANFGANATRWHWAGPSGGTIISCPAQSFAIDGITIDTNPANNSPGVTQAGIGIHYVASHVDPKSIRMSIGEISIDGAATGIFCGTDKAAAAAALAADSATPTTNGSYTGSNEAHADTIRCRYLQLRAITEAGIWVANTQSVGHEFQHLEAIGFASPTVPLVRLQRGNASINYADILNNCTLLEIGKPNAQVTTVARFHCDAQADQTCLVRYQTGYTGRDNPNGYRSEVVIGPGNIPDKNPRSPDTYVIDTGNIGRTGTVTLIGVTGLRPGSIKINGAVEGTYKHIFHVNLIGCEIANGTDVRALVDESRNGSTTLWSVSWKNCTTANYVDGGTTWRNLLLPDGRAWESDVPLAAIEQDRREQYAWYENPGRWLRDNVPIFNQAVAADNHASYGRGEELDQLTIDARYALENMLVLPEALPAGRSLSAKVDVPHVVVGVEHRGF